MTEESFDIQQFAPYKAQKVGGRYVNPHIEDTKRTLKDFLLWQLGYYNDPELPAEPPPSFAYPNPIAEHAPEKPHIAWINHSSFYVSCHGINLLTDPIFSSRCSPVAFVGPKRAHPPAIELEMLPPIHMVLISHNHYDHLDERSVKRIHARNPDVLFAVPRGVKRWFERRGIKNVIELSWWEAATIQMPHEKDVSIRIRGVPTQHFSGRGLFDTDATLWCGFVVDFFGSHKLPKRLYFCGDTGYNEHDFKEIGNVCGGMDLSLIPVGTYVPKQFMSPVHIGPEEATAIHQDVRSHLSVGMHWKTFRLSGEQTHQPPYDLFLSMKEKELEPLTFRILEPGQIINW